MNEQIKGAGYFKIKLLPYGKVDIVTQEYALSIFPLEDETLYTIFFHGDGSTESITKKGGRFNSYSSGLVKPAHELHVDNYPKVDEDTEVDASSDVNPVIYRNKLLLSLKPIKAFNFGIGSRMCMKWYPMYFAFHFPGYVVNKVQFANEKSHDGKEYMIFQKIESIDFFMKSYKLEAGLKSVFKGLKNK